MDFVPLSKIVFEPAPISCTSGFIGPITYSLDRVDNITVVAGSLDDSREAVCAATFSRFDFSVRGKSLSIAVGLTE